MKEREIFGSDLHYRKNVFISLIIIIGLIGGSGCISKGKNEKKKEKEDECRISVSSLNDSKFDIIHKSKIMKKWNKHSKIHQVFPEEMNMFVFFVKSKKRIKVIFHFF